MRLWFSELAKILCKQTLKEYILSCLPDTPSFEVAEKGILEAWAFVGADGTVFNQCNVASVEQVINPDVSLTDPVYQVTFATPIDPASYPVVFGNINNGETRDGRDTEVIDGTQTANGFQYYVTEGDNGQSADTLVEGQANFHIAGKCKVLVPAECPVTEITGIHGAVGDGFIAGPNEYTHFHAGPQNHMGGPGQDLWEVGGFFGDESVRGVIDFALAGAPQNIQSAELKLDVSGAGLDGQAPYTGDIEVFAYAGNGTIDLADATAGTSIGVANIANPTISVPIALLAGGNVGFTIRQYGPVQANYFGFDVKSISTSCGTFTPTDPFDPTTIQTELNQFLAANGGGTATVSFDFFNSIISIEIDGSTCTFNSVNDSLTGTTPFDLENNFAGASTGTARLCITEAC